MEEEVQAQQPEQNISKKDAIRNWSRYHMSQELVNSLVSNNFVKPTEVQTQTLVYLEQHVDMVIAAKTGQGKTLTFALPILDLLIKRLQKPGKEEEEFKSIKALIMSPTRELAIQIKDHISAIIPVEYSSKIKVCPLVGGMSIQKQERLLSYEPTIIIATPGRLWELLDSQMNTYLQSELPLIDVLVLDEADRMIEDGHFKELGFILNYIYTKRVEFKKFDKSNDKETKEISLNSEKANEIKKSILSQKNNELSKNLIVGKNLEGKFKGKKIDMSKVVDLVDEEAFLQNLNPEDLVIEEDKEESKEDQEGGQKKGKKEKKISKNQLKKEEEEEFAKIYHKMGGIQHIICSATMTIDNQGRITPKKAKFLKKKGIKTQDQQNTLESLCKVLRFRSKTPRVIDLTDETRMPDTLIEKFIRCKNDEKDLYLYYYLRSKQGQSFIIFCNSITSTKRINSLLNFMKVKNNVLHSKMQQRQRLRNLDRFKSQVSQIENGINTQEGKPQVMNAGLSAILVCTDVAARGLDIPNVANVIHYQCPFNAEIYVHRSGRTARIGKSGDAFAILGPEDEKSFKVICKVLQKPPESIQMFNVSYTQINKLEPLINTAKEFEAAMHKKTREYKSANQLYKAAQNADLPLDDAMQREIEEKIGRRLVDKELKNLDDDDNNRSKGAKHKSKEETKMTQLKKKYDSLKQQEVLKKFSNSSYLTPEAAMYLNELISTKEQSRADPEIVYAGLHSEFAKETKFKRKEKYTSRYKNRNKRKKRT